MKQEWAKKAHALDAGSSIETRPTTERSETAMTFRFHAVDQARGVADLDRPA